MRDAAMLAAPQSVEHYLLAMRLLCRGTRTMAPVRSTESSGGTCRYYTLTRAMPVSNLKIPVRKLACIISFFKHVAHGPERSHFSLLHRFKLRANRVVEDLSVTS